MKTVLLLTAICLLSYLTHGAADPPEQKTASWYWHRGLEAAHRNAADTALVFLKQSYGKGIPDDSLCYLWAEIFLYKNILDTALALNFSIKPESGGIRQKAFEQRYLIYTKLGWQKEAAALRDSLSGRHGRLLRRIVPECNFALTGGGYREKSAADRGYPYARPTDSSALVSDGIGDASLRMGWQVKTGKTQNLQFGARLRYAGSRISRASLDKRFNDSTDVSAGGYLRYKLFSDRFAAGYACNRRQDFLDRESFLHQFTLQYAVITKNWLASLNAGYQYRNPYQRHYYYLTGLLDRPVGGKNDLGLMLQFAGLSTDDRPIVTVRQPFINVKDSTAYYDTTYTRAVVNSGTNFPFDSLYDTLTVESSIPQSFLSVNPRLSIERRFTGRFSSGVNAGYRLSWFRRKYCWVDFGYSDDDLPKIVMEGYRSELALDAATRNYYWIALIPRNSRIHLDSVPVVFHRERRVDQTLSLNLFLNYNLDRFGSMLLDVTMERNFSTFMNAAPVDIQKWYGETTLTWFFKFKP